MIERLNDDVLEDVVKQEGPSRRIFLQFCAGAAVTLGLSAGAEKAIARAIATKRRPPVIWLHFAECTGCTQSLMVSENPALGKLILL